jgi:hypothetical protein
MDKVVASATHAVAVSATEPGSRSLGSDAAEVIGAQALKASGLGHRPSATRLGRPASTVRGWLRAFTGNAERIRVVVTALLAELDPLAGPIPVHRSGFADAVEAVGAVTAAARRRPGVVGAVSPWQFVSAATGGRLLAPAPTLESINTS